MSVAIGHCKMSKEEIALNIQLAANFLASLLKKNWQNIKVGAVGGSVDIRVVLYVYIRTYVRTDGWMEGWTFATEYVDPPPNHPTTQEPHPLILTLLPFPPFPTGHVRQEHHGPPLPDLLLSASFAPSRRQAVESRGPEAKNFPLLPLPLFMCVFYNFLRWKAVCFCFG